MSCICVVGMHRSGTSCLTGIMQNFGVELGEVFTENLYNKRGNRENGRIMQLNEALLNHFGGAWNNPVAITNWPDAAKPERDAIIEELEGRSSQHWGFKDPRTLFMLDFWEEAIGQVKLIGTIRHPHRVALSLNNRDDTPFEQGWELWFAYNRKLLDLANERQFALVDFDLNPDDYLDDAISKLIALGLDSNSADKARNFFDSSLRNQTDTTVDDIQLPEHVEKLHQDLLDYIQNYST
ncbi:MAG: hypothetical protein ACR2QG_04380 [Gammaproteobacteria bacterium]